MRYYVEACFDAAASGVVISDAPGEDSAVLVADGGHVELRLGSPNASQSSAAQDAHTLRVLPWDSSALRVTLNGVGYGTGPLLLHDRDVLTLRPAVVGEEGDGKTAGHEYTYTVTTLSSTSIYSVSETSAAVKSNSEEKGARDADAAVQFICAEDQQHPLTIASNLAEYAKWNNFYSDRFGGSAAMASMSDGPNGPLRRCVCGCHVPTAAATRRNSAARDTAAFLGAHNNVGRAAGDAPTISPSAATAASPPRTLVTLYPALPSLLLAEPGEEGEKTCACRHHGAPAVVSCCACPFLYPRAGGVAAPAAAAQPSLSVSQAAPSSAQAKKQHGAAREGGNSAPLSSSSGLSPWSHYVAQRRQEWKPADPKSATKERDSASGGDGGAGLRGPIDRPSAELLYRLNSLEGALMGCRYE